MDKQTTHTKTVQSNMKTGKMASTQQKTMKFNWNTAANMRDVAWNGREYQRVPNKYFTEE